MGLKFPMEYCLQKGIDGGAFAVPFVVPFKVVVLRVIASNGLGWDHVSVSVENRCPNWREMCFIKNLFFEEEDCVIQYHPPKSKYKNYHDKCLHLWRPHHFEIAMPPIEFV